MEGTMSFLSLSAKIVGPVLLVAALASGGFAVARAASNTVPASKAGDGLGAASGYTASAIVYTLDGSDPTKVSQVAFTLDSAPPASSTIKVLLDSSGTNWHACAFVTTSVTCDTTTGTEETVAGIDELRVIAVQ
jgi:hypothetical protein